MRKRMAMIADTKNRHILTDTELVRTCLDVQIVTIALVHIRRVNIGIVKDIRLMCIQIMCVIITIL